MKILSINTATVGDLFTTQPDQKKKVKTGINKQPVTDKVAVHQQGLVGDERADQFLHGGLDKAVYAYPIEHYDFWNGHRASHLKRPLAESALTFGSLGENLTTEGILESDVWVGDQLRIGEVILQVTEPRHPCFKLNAKLELAHAGKLMIQSGYSGFYMRVIESGTMVASDPITLVPGPRKVAITWLNERRRKGRQEDLF
jgi:MOSC domain-containing protein YiiM